MNDHENFPVQQFYEALMSQTGLQQKLQPIVKQIQNKNMQIIYQSILHIHEILNSKLQPPLMKVNALISTKILFSTCEYSIILLIEVYLLPIIFQIAVFRSTKKSQESLSLYFIERGAQPTKQVKKLGFNYVTLAIQFIYLTSQIKIYRTLQNEELEQQSNFKKIVKALKMRKVSQPSSWTFFNNLYVQQIRKVYLYKLNGFNPENFIDYISEILFSQIIGQKNPQLDSKRLIMFGDVYIISPLVNKVQEELNEMNGNFQVKRKILTMFFQLVRYGYIQAILLLNSSQFLSQICQQISKVQGDKDMDEGRLIYQQINDNSKAKKLFYLQYLKCIQAWQHAIPLNENNEQSDPKRIYQFLKYQKKFKFPQNPNKHKYKSEMEIYLRQNSQRNQKVVELIDSRQQISTKSRYKISSLQDESNIKQKKKKNVAQFQQLQEIIIDAMKILQVIGYSEKKYQKQMKKLISFKNDWHDNLQSVKQNNHQNAEPFNLQMLISEGQIVYEQIVELQKIYQKFNNKSIIFKQAQQKINDLLNKLQEDITGQSQVSVSAKSKNTGFTNRRDLKSKISQKVRNDKSFSNHSQVSQNKSAKSNFKINREKGPYQSKKLTQTYNVFQHNNYQKEHQRINDTFAIDKNDKQIKKIVSPKTKIQALQKQINFLDNKSQVQLNNKRSEKNNQNKEQVSFHTYGLGQSVKNKNNFPTATFILPVNQNNLKNQNSNKKIKTKQSKNNQSFNDQLIKENDQLNNIKKHKNQKQVFGDSFQLQSIMKKPSSIKKLENEFILNLNTSQQKIQFSRQNYQKQQNQKITNSKQKLNTSIKRILSNDKAAPNKITFSQSSDEEIQIKNKIKNSQNKKISKFVSFNNGNNFSGYFNENSIEQYGFQDHKETNKKNKKSVKQISNQNLSSDDQFKKNLNSGNIVQLLPQASKNSLKMVSSKQISKIKDIEGNSFEAPNLDDFQLIKGQKKNQRQNKPLLNQSQMSQVMKLNITDKIKDQESFQMLESHYGTRQIEIEKKNKKQRGQDIKFGQIVQVRKQIIHSKNNCLSPINNRQEVHSNNKMKKILQLKQGLLNKRQNKKNNLMEVLSQRSTKKCIQMYLIQKQKNKLIKNLNLRIQNLQNQQRTLKTKLSRKDQQLRSMSFKNYSQKHKIKFTVQNSAQVSLEQSSRLDIHSFRDHDSSNFNNSLYAKITTQNGPFVKNTNPFGSQQHFSEQNIIDLSIYDNYFPTDLSSNTFKKNCLKNKTLLVSNGEIQVGCMSLKKDQVINFTLFITPKAYSIKNLKPSLTQNQDLKISIFPNFLYQIKQKKQQTLHIKIIVQKIPYKIPKLNFAYQFYMNQSKTKTKNQKLIQNIQIVLPCTFNKLCTFESINSNDFISMFCSGENPFENIKSSKKFKINGKIFKEQKLKQYFPFLCVIKKKQVASSGKCIERYGFEANYNGNIFLIVLSIQDGKYCRIQSKNMTGSVKNQKFIQFFMSTFKKLLT